MKSSIVRRAVALAAASSMAFSMLALPARAEEVAEDASVSGSEAAEETVSLTYESFTDLMDPDDEWNWYYDGVSYVVENGYMIGIADGIFGPDDPTTRAMVVTILYRMASDTIDMETLGEIVSNFSDVDMDSWYSDAVAWAEDNQIALGYGTAIFGVSDEVTREQFATFLYRYALFMDYDTSASADLTGFPDEEEVSSWSEEAISWAVANGIILGEEINGITYLAPEDSCTRAMTAEIIYRFVGYAGGLDEEDAEAGDSSEPEEEELPEDSMDSEDSDESGENTGDSGESGEDTPADEDEEEDSSTVMALEDGTYYFLQLSEDEDGNVLYTIYSCIVEEGEAGEMTEVLSTTDPVGTITSLLAEQDMEEYASALQNGADEILSSLESVAAVTIGNGSIYFLDSEGNILYVYELSI